MDLKVPVLFLIFNRPAITQRVFDAIRQAKPSRLFVAADGPRDNRSGEAERCEQTRRIIDTVDWDCEVTTLFREKNLGCRKAVSSAIDWFFTNVEEGIILEDDCLPSQSFFDYCQGLLEYYRYDRRIMQICGSNLLKEWNRSGYSYFFSNYGPVWGWASWRRAWQYNDVNMKLWPEIRGKKLYEDFCQSIQETEFRLELYDKVFSGQIDTWDYQWGFAKMISSGLSITPTNNMISNIGFGVDATHTNILSSLSGLRTYDIDFPLKHPEFIIKDKIFDVEYNQTYLPQKPLITTPSLLQKMMYRLRNYLNL
jgi:hypothetical protein